jgi:hypothetical protein
LTEIQGCFSVNFERNSIYFFFQKEFDLLKELYNIFHILLEFSEGSWRKIFPRSITRLDILSIKAGLSFSMKPNGSSLKELVDAVSVSDI